MNNVEIFFCITLVVVFLLFFCAWLDKRKKDKEAARKAYHDALERKALNGSGVNNPRVTSSGSIKKEPRPIVNRHSGVQSTRTPDDNSIDDDYWASKARNDSLNMAAQTHYSGSTECHGSYDGGGSSGSSGSSDYSSTCD